MEQDFKGSCNGKLNPEFKSLAMVRNKEEREERQDELENVVKCCEKCIKVICISQDESRLRDGSAQSEDEESRERKLYVLAEHWGTENRRQGLK